MGFTNEVRTEDLAKATEGSAHINESGVYFGEITLAEYSKSPSGAGFFTLSLKTDDGKILSFASICAIKKDGNDAFGMAFYKTACLFTSSQMQDPIHSDKTNKDGFPNLYGKHIGVGVEVEHLTEFNAEGYQKTRKTIVGIYDYSTKKSVSEVASNSQASKYLVDVIDKGQKIERNSYTASEPAHQGQGMPNDDELPF